jgi:hypothetical protein
LLAAGPSGVPPLSAYTYQRSVSLVLAKVVSMEDARGRLRRLVASCPPDLKLTLAARNEDELSDADVLGMLQDFEELGIVPPGDESGGRP